MSDLQIVIDADTARQQRDRHLDKALRAEREAKSERTKAAIWEARAERADAGNPVVMTPSRRGQIAGPGAKP